MIDNLINKVLLRDIKVGNFDFSSYKLGTVGGFSIEYFEESDNSFTSYIYKSKEDLIHDSKILMDIWR